VSTAACKALHKFSSNARDALTAGIASSPATAVMPGVKGASSTIAKLAPAAEGRGRLVSACWMQVPAAEEARSYSACRASS